MTTVSEVTDAQARGEAPNPALADFLVYLEAAILQADGVRQRFDTDAAYVSLSRDVRALLDGSAQAVGSGRQVSGSPATLEP